MDDPEINKRFESELTALRSLAKARSGSAATVLVPEYSERPRLERLRSEIVEANLMWYQVSMRRRIHVWG